MEPSPTCTRRLAPRGAEAVRRGGASKGRHKIEAAFPLRQPAPLKPRLPPARSQTRLSKNPQNRTTMRRPTSRCGSCTSRRGSRCSCGITSRRSKTSGRRCPSSSRASSRASPRAARERRWEVIFLTTRPSTAGELVQLQSQRWLAAHGFQYPSVLRRPALARQDRRCACSSMRSSTIARRTASTSRSNRRPR